MDLDSAPPSLVYPPSEIILANQDMPRRLKISLFWPEPTTSLKFLFTRASLFYGNDLILIPNSRVFPWSSFDLFPF